MRFPLIPALLLMLLCCGIDVYIYRLLRGLRRRIWSSVQLVSAAVLLLVFIVIICMPKRHGDNSTLLMVMWGVYTIASVYLAKFAFVLFDLLSRLPMLWHSRRWKWLSVCGVVVAVSGFLLMWWGALVNRFNISVEYVEYASPKVPAAFDGFRIIQLSDLHVGTYGTDDSFLRKLVEKVNSLHPDAIVFTGDIVNRRSSELEPFTGVFGELKAPYGVWSILGNHDYGDYYDWTDAGHKLLNMQQLKDMQHRMHWRLLCNEHEPIAIGGDTLMLIGVENIGDPPFRNYGDLSKAYPDRSDKYFKILLSHTPSHWEMEIENKPDQNVALTLSGHTHAMQLSIGHILSPSVFRYKTWGGMYHDDYGHSLYVNIGAGTVGLPARIGATPEITVITLRHLQ